MKTKCSTKMRSSFLPVITLSLTLCACIASSYAVRGIGHKEYPSAYTSNGYQPQIEHSVGLSDADELTRYTGAGGHHSKNSKLSLGVKHDRSPHTFLSGLDQSERHTIRRNALRGLSAESLLSADNSSLSSLKNLVKPQRKHHASSSRRKQQQQQQEQAAAGSLLMNDNRFFFTPLSPQQVKALVKSEKVNPVVKLNNTKRSKSKSSKNNVDDLVSMRPKAKSLKQPKIEQNARKSPEEEEDDNDEDSEVSDPTYEPPSEYFQKQPTRELNNLKLNTRLEKKNFIYGSSSIYPDKEVGTMSKNKKSQIQSKFSPRLDAADELATKNKYRVTPNLNSSNEQPAAESLEAYDETEDE